MANDPRKRQKKLEKRAAKRKEKRQIIHREQSAGLPERLAAASKYPVVDCRLGDSFGPEGIASLLFSRDLPGGWVAAAVFLVDRYCLGVKDAFGEVLPRPAYEEKFLRRMASRTPSHPLAPADARKLLESAVAYARGLGIQPHPDYARLMVLFGDVSAADSTATFEFGQDGKPYFFAGPNDSPARCRQVLSALEHSCGPGGYHYLLPISGRDRIVPLPDALDFEGDEDFDEDEEAAPPGR